MKDLKKLFATYTIHKVLMSRLYKEYLQIIVEKWIEIMNRQVAEEIQLANKNKRKLNLKRNYGNANYKH